METNYTIFHSPNDVLDITRVKDILEEYGVVVIENYFTAEEAENWKTNIIEWLINISDDLTEDPKTWKILNLPYGPRKGMMQSLITHCPTIWKLRERMYPLFCEIWNTEDLITSLDGATVCPPMYTSGKDWAHLDQTVENLICYQGQVVLSDSTSSFVCTPKSHLQHTEVLNICDKVGDKGNWLKFNEEQVGKVKPLFDEWQVPIRSGPGSIILWDSRTIHSAKRNNKGDPGWRCTTYICMRPKEQYSKRDLNKIKKCVVEGRSTNHWGTRMFPKRPGAGRFGSKRSDSIEKYSDNPKIISDKLELTETMKKIVGM